MKCSNPNCTTDMTHPPLAVNVGDLENGAYWGLYCSYKCVINEIGSLWVHLGEGKAFSDFKPVPFEAAVPEAPVPNGAGIPPMTVAPTDAGITTNEWAAPVPAAPVPEAEPVDAFAIPGIEAVVEDPIPAAAKKARVLNDNLAKQLLSHFKATNNGVKKNESVTYQIEGNDYKYTSYELHFTLKKNILPVCLDVVVVDSIKPQVVISIPEYPAGNINIDPTAIDLSQAFTPIVNHLYAVDQKVTIAQPETTEAADVTNF